ncbi:hypothetical protein Scep_004183 [Stephania cephalantha]|uniref:Uncharacterized protein n=1 Tax=Stephania cephalantha TaxID=152367 RepID=A0AAP0KTK5_9MAGN
MGWFYIYFPQIFPPLPQIENINLSTLLLFFGFAPPLCSSSPYCSSSPFSSSASTAALQLRPSPLLFVALLHVALLFFSFNCSASPTALFRLRLPYPKIANPFNEGIPPRCSSSPPTAPICLRSLYLFLALSLFP